MKVLMDFMDENDVNRIQLFEIIQQHVRLYYSMLMNTMIENHRFKIQSIAQCEQFDRTYCMVLLL